MNLDLSLNTLAVPLLAGLCAILGIFLQRTTEKIKIIQSQLTDKKYKVYNELFTIFFDIIGNTIDDKEPLPDDHKQRMLSIKRDIFIYGTDEIFYKFSNWLVETTNTNENQIKSLKNMKLFVELFILIRKDMGNKDTKVNVDDFMIFTIQNKTTYYNFKKANGW